MRWEYQWKSRVQITPVCPKCNSTNVAKYLWGLRPLDDQLERDIEEGRVIFWEAALYV